ncbi:MAG TPA: hypothetical protein VLR90_01610 [Blastocatellia bacterium]|nr:hypothetical protein [Blastocatellia bacterium]
MAEITAKQEKAIAALIAEQTIRDAAAKSGITEQTLFRWLKDESFNAEYMRARRDAVQQAVARMQSATGEAVETLRAVMNDSNAKGSERVSAAKAIIDFAYKGIDLEDFAARLSAIEAAIKDKPK